jgi:methyl-accepting chemotaxis protein
VDESVQSITDLNQKVSLAMTSQEAASANINKVVDDLRAISETNHAEAIELRSENAMLSEIKEELAEEVRSLSR